NGLSYGVNAGYGVFPPNSGTLVCTEAEAAVGPPVVFHGYGSPSALFTLGGNNLILDTGVFIRGFSEAGLPGDEAMTLDRISLRDGMGQTLMLIENHNAQNWGGSLASYTGAGGALYPAPGTSAYTPSALPNAIMDCAVVVNYKDLA